MPTRPGVTRSVRLDRDVDAMLRQLATHDGVSVNLMVNRALRKFVEWDAYGEKFGLIAMPNGILFRMMDYLSDAQVRELGTWVGKNLLREFITFWFKEITPKSFLESCPRLLARYGRAFEYEERTDDGHRVIILKHGGGPKWSTFYSEVLRTGLKELLGKDANIDKSENQVAIRILFLG